MIHSEKSTDLPNFQPPLRDVLNFSDKFREAPSLLQSFQPFLPFVQVLPAVSPVAVELGATRDALRHFGISSPGSPAVDMSNAFWRREGCEASELKELCEVIYTHVYTHSEREIYHI